MAKRTRVAVSLAPQPDPSWAMRLLGSKGRVDQQRDQAGGERLGAAWAPQVNRDSALRRVTSRGGAGTVAQMAAQPAASPSPHTQPSTLSC